MFRLIIFDLDGVLWISNDAHVEVCRRALTKAGVDPSADLKEITYYFGLPYRDVLRQVMGSKYTPEKLEVALEEQRRLLYSDHFFEGVEEIEGVRGLLVNLRRVGVKLAVASGNERGFLDKALKHLGLNDVFDLVLSADDVKNSKPDPEMIHRTMETLGVGSDETIFVGDARNDVLAAKNANVRSAVVLTGTLSRESASALKPDFILESVLDVESLIR